MNPASREPAPRQSAPQREARPRCAKHQLVLTPEGECMLCRRDAMGTGAAVVSQITFTHLIIAGVLFAGIVVAFLVFVSSGGVRRVEKGLERQGIAIHKPAEPSPDSAEAQAAQAPSDPAEKSVRDVLEEKEALKAARREVSVVFYTKPGCTLCEQASTYLKDKDVFVDERNIEESADYASELAALSPKGLLPVIKVEEQSFIGWEPVRVETAIEAAARAHLPATAEAAP